MDKLNFSLRGRDTIAGLACIYPQLYLRPGESDPGAYRDIVLCGHDAPSHDLSHFSGHEDDSCLIEQTPVGSVPVITLHQRADFELFLQIMAHRCTPVPIPKTQGAAMLQGVINRRRIEAHRDDYLLSYGADADWDSEFSRFTSDKANYTDTLIVLSCGPYSAVSADRAGLPEQEWIAASHTIRKVHECTHFLCRTLFPDKKDAVWDELVADAAGLAAAFGRFDPELEKRFLGIEGEQYTGGRLENYLTEDDGGKKQPEALIGKILPVLSRFESIAASFRGETPYDLAIRLEEEIGCWKQP